MEGSDEVREELGVAVDKMTEFYFIWDEIESEDHLILDVILRTGQTFG